MRTDLTPMPDELMPPRSKTLGALLRLARERRGLSQEQLGDLVGKRQTTVSSWELGDSRPRVTDLPLIAEVLGVDPERLLRLHLGMPEPKGGPEPLEERLERLQGLVGQLMEELEEIRRERGEGR